MTAIYVDGDACPVKNEILRVAARYGLHVHVVANSWLRLPQSPTVHLVTVGTEGLDVADDWIAERVGPGDICVTADIPLADRVLKAGAAALNPAGRPYTPDSIGNTLATRNLLTSLREAGTITGGGRPFTKADRSRFLQALDAMVVAQRRRSRPGT